MSGYNYQSNSDDFNEVERNGSGGNLRKMLEDALAENKKLLNKLNKQEREKSATDLLKDKGLDPAIAELIPDDTEPAAWVEKYAHLLGVKTDAPPLQPVVEPEIVAAVDDDPALVAEREALAAMQDAHESGLPPAVANSLLEKMDKIGSEEQLIAFFNSNGATGG